MGFPFVQAMDDINLLEKLSFFIEIITIMTYLLVTHHDVQAVDNASYIYS